MSLLFVALVSSSTFFAGLALFEVPTRREKPRAGRWSVRTRPSLRARWRRAS